MDELKFAHKKYYTMQLIICFIVLNFKHKWKLCVVK